MRYASLSALAAALALAVPFSASAQDPTALDDRWEVSASWFQPDVSLSGRADIRATNGDDSIVGAGFGRQSDDFSGARVQVSFRPTQRQRIIAGWYGVKNDRSESLARSGTFVPEVGVDPVDYNVEASARFDARFQLYQLSYGYDFIQTPATTVTGLVGVYGARASAELSSSGMAVVDGETFDLSSHSHWSETKYAPGLGLAVSYRPADRWEIRAAAQGFQTSWGDFGTDGHFLHATAQVGYELTPAWTIFAGYDHFNLELKDDVSGAVDYDGTRYQAQGPVSARLKVHGPTLGFRASF